MMGFVSYVGDLLVYFLVAGIGLHVLDRKFGVPVYRWWYSRSRTTPIPENEEVGFMYRRAFTQRHNRALLISGVQSLYMFFHMHINLFTEIGAFFLEAWCLLLGFKLGEYVYAYMRGEKKIVNVLEKLHPAQLFSRGRMKISQLIDTVWPAKPAAPKAQVESASPPPVASPPLTPEEVLDRFTNGRR